MLLLERKQANGSKIMSARYEIVKSKYFLQYKMLKIPLPGCQLALSQQQIEEFCKSASEQLFPYLSKVSEVTWYQALRTGVSTLAVFYLASSIYEDIKEVRRTGDWRAFCLKIGLVGLGTLASLAIAKYIPIPGAGSFVALISSMGLDYLKIRFWPKNQKTPC